MREIIDMNMESKDLVSERVEVVKTIFPEVVTEGNGSIDFEKLRLTLGDEISDDDERYSFIWPGKRDAIRQAQMPSIGTLRPSIEESRNRDGIDASFDSGNLYIEGDNLEVLKLLQHSYHGKIQLIYIDPPYNTGKDFVYKDSFGGSIENYKEQAKLTGQSNADTSGRYHSDWCSMIYPRIKLARELLSDDGVFYVSISDIEVSNLRIICDELFGAKNFVADLIWENREGGGSSDSRLFRIKHEHILCYAKSIEEINIVGVPISNEDRYKGKDEYYVDRGPYYLQKLGMGSIQYSESLDYPIDDPNGGVIYPADNNQGKKACWRWSKDKFDWGVENGYIVVKKDPSGVWTVYSKQYLNCDNEGNRITRTQRPMGVIENYSSTQASKQLDRMGLGGLFDYTKPVELIEYLIGRTNKPRIVLDFFSGSGTTAQAVMQSAAGGMSPMQFILVQLPEIRNDSVAKESGFNSICDIAKERIRRVGTKIATEIEELNRQPKLGENPKTVPDIGFRVFKLDESNIINQSLNEVVDHGELLNAEMLFDGVVKADRSDLDIVFEMMLKWGLELTLPVEKIEAAGYSCYSVAAGELICCMTDGLSIEALKVIAEMEPRRVLMLDSILTDTLKLNAGQIFKHVGDRTGIEVELRTV